MHPSHALRHPRKCTLVHAQLPNNASIFVITKIVSAISGRLTVSGALYTDHASVGWARVHPDTDADVGTVRRRRAPRHR